MPAPERITIMGIGNPLVRDEGAGIRVIEVLMTDYTFPENVDLVDAGTMGIGLLHLLRECDYLLIIDAVDGTGEEPGTIVRLTPEEMAPNQVRHSLHDTTFVDVLEAAELIGCRPKADCVGVQIKQLAEMKIGLTDEVEAAVPAAVEAVLQVLSEHGVEPIPAEQTSEEADVLEMIRDFEERPRGSV